MGIKRTLRRAKRFVCDHKVAFMVGGAGVVLTALGVGVYKGLPDYKIDTKDLKDLGDALIDIPQNTDIGPDCLVKYHDGIILDRVFEDIQGAGGYLMDHWDEIVATIGDEYGSVYVSPLKNELEGQVQLFCQV